MRTLTVACEDVLPGLKECILLILVLLPWRELRSLPAWLATLLTAAKRFRRHCEGVIGSGAEVSSYWYVEVSGVVVRGGG